MNANSLRASKASRKVVSHFSLFVISVDFDTTTQRRPPYYQLKKLLQTLGGVLTPTHQITLVLSPLKASQIRDQIARKVLNTGDRVYVGKIATGSAWKNLLHVSNADLKAVLRTWARGANPSAGDVKAAATAITGLLPRRRG